MALALFATACSTKTSNQPLQATLRLELTECGTSNEQRASAVAVDRGPGNLAVTVAHAFDNIESFVVQEANGSTMTAELVHLDVDRDLAVIRLERGAAETLGVADPNVETTDVSLITYSNDDGPERKPASILRFVRLSLDGVGDRDGIELGADIESGDSGGPVIDDEGRLVGMVFATSRGDDRGWAVASNEIERAIDAATTPIPLVCR